VQAQEDAKLAHALIVEDHPLFSDALSMTLKTIPGVETVATASRLEDALAHMQAQPTTDIIMLDLNLPDVNGLDGLLRLHRAAGNVPILVVSSMAENRMISSVMRAGAQGFVPKHSQREVFHEAFETIARGETYLPEGYVEVPASADADTAQSVALSRIATLTDQQARILQLICEGKLNKQIAFDLSIAETTVKAHVTAIMRKLGVQSRTQAVLIANQAQFSNFLPKDDA